jgi:hypothetical protein
MLVHHGGLNKHNELGVLRSSGGVARLWGCFALKDETSITSSQRDASERITRIPLEPSIT